MSDQTLRLFAPGMADLDLRHPQIMGVLNVTPDSFSEAPEASRSAEAAVAAGLQMAQEGAMVLDVGPESTRPGAQRVSIQEQLERIRPAAENRTL